MIRCAAALEQRQGPDLSRLPELVDEVRWLDLTELEQTAEPAVLCGLWIAKDPARARALVKSRVDAGRATVFVPRFKAGDLAPIMGAPTSVDVRAGDFSGVTWEDGQHYAVSGLTFLKTNLHAGQWAVASGLGTAVLSYRQRTSAGQIVICTAAATGRPGGVALSEQRRLFVRILDEIGTPSHSEAVLEREMEKPTDLESFLVETGDRGAEVLLALLANTGRNAEDVVRSAMAALHLSLRTEQVERILARLPNVDDEAIEVALREHGWGAYIRRLRDALTEEPAA